ncbi:flavodoxin domain-containing protein [Haloarchaeobius sp. DFWS5]|uniref:flavodoxin domain-containing protein n=1 Tax=Haloarchaeobius sp. DFWS5 TaxID=3446114 RepID=UPI003EB712DD
MATILVSYATGEGQTANVAAAIERDLASHGHAVTTVDIAELPPTLDVAAFDAVVVGASIHMGKHQDSVAAFVRANRPALSARPSAFFQVCLSSAVDDDERRREAEGYVESFVAETSWHPDRVASFGGALRYSEYGLLKRVLMKRLAKDATGDIDTSRDYEYTDWDDVDRFADGFATFVEAAPGPTESTIDR